MDFEIVFTMVRERIEHKTTTGQEVEVLRAVFRAPKASARDKETAGTMVSSLGGSTSY